MAKTVLVINSGSSSIKYQLVDLESGEGLASGLVEKIGEPVDGHYKHEYNGEKHELEEPIHDHEQGLKRVLGFFKEYGPDLSEAGIVAVGHRVVQGGSLFPKPALVTDKTINAVKDLAVLAPLHNGPEAKGAEVMRALLPDVPQIFVFDSSFFFQLPKAASTYALNKEIADQYHPPLRRPRHLARVHLLRGPRRHRQAGRRPQADRAAHRQRSLRLRRGFRQAGRDLHGSDSA